MFLTIVNVGDEIIATDENAELVVVQVLDKGTSESVDFMARYKIPSGVDRQGNTLNAGRGFSYLSDNWRFLKDEH